MRKGKGMVLLSLLLVTVVLVAACTAGSKAPDKAKQPIKIGVATSRSGPLEYYGTMEIRGLELGIDYATGGTREVLGRKIEILVEDDTGDPGVGVQKARKLLESDQVDILQGSASSGVALAIQKLAPQYKKVFVVEPAAADSITGQNFNRYTFRTGSNVSQDALAGGKYVARQLGKTFVHLAPDYAWGRESAAAWKRALEGEGGKVIAEEFAPLNTTDFTPYLEKVVAARPEVLVVSWAGSGAVKLFEQIREQGLYKKMKVTTGFGDSRSLQAMGDTAVGLVGVSKYAYTLPKNQVNDWLIKTHQEKYQEPPDIFTAGGFAAGVAIVEGLKKAGSTEAEALIQAMEGMSFETPKGTMTFRREDHQALQPMYVAEMVKDAAGKPVLRLLQEMSAQETAPPVNLPK